MEKKILIVEDEVSMAKALEEKFQLEGFSVVYAKNGKEGLEIAEKEKPDIILLDIVMPVMDGITMLKNMKEIEDIKDIPVIILTNLSDNEKLSEAMANGSYYYLVKSDWKIQNVVEKVKEKLGISH